MTVVSGDEQRAAIRSDFPISLRVQVKTKGNPESGVPVTFTVQPAAGAGGLFDGTAYATTVTTDNGGEAAAPRLTANSTPGLYKVQARATCDGDGSPFSVNFGLTNIAPVYYLPWNQVLTGGTVPTVTITVLYATPAPQTSKMQFGGGTPATSGITAGLGGTGSGGPPSAADQAVVVVTSPLPQVHSMYAYNLSFGVIGSTVHEPSFTRLANAPPCPMGTPPPGTAASGTCGTYTNASSNSSAVEPVVFFTTYVPQRFDAESHWHPREMIWPIAPSFGISLTQPSTDFFFGESSEVRRGVEVVYGLHLARTNYVLSGENLTSSTAPPTGQHLTTGFFYGVTFTLNFVQSLFSGGGPK